MYYFALHILQHLLKLGFSSECDLCVCVIVA